MILARKEEDSVSEKQDLSQTAEPTAGIPTPPEGEDVGPADSLNEWVEAVMDTIQRDFTGGAEHSAYHEDEGDRL
ncbi:hypothetical protein SD70_20505 [Gordoniibacillus kamchatkensis]|uniref:Uncharacterized protein n=1 Tax=Gordoniibacillus kamchatkensis TaxID=1590651 RepID=A0ABR5AF65_9BACL|nr:hypothetical protein SD70_20505 [Paenibacillus sp. VKM B-2647]